MLPAGQLTGTRSIELPLRHSFPDFFCGIWHKPGFQLVNYTLYDHEGLLLIRLTHTLPEDFWNVETLVTLIYNSHTAFFLWTFCVLKKCSAVLCHMLFLNINQLTAHQNTTYSNWRNMLHKFVASPLIFLKNKTKMRLICICFWQQIFFRGNIVDFIFKLTRKFS